MKSGVNWVFANFPEFLRKFIHLTSVWWVPFWVPNPIHISLVSTIIWKKSAKIHTFLLPTYIRGFLGPCVPCPPRSLGGQLYTVVYIYGLLRWGGNNFDGCINADTSSQRHSSEDNLLLPSFMSCKYIHVHFGTWVLTKEVQDGPSWSGATTTTSLMSLVSKWHISNHGAWASGNCWKRVHK
jgi:hypothetical protein